MVLLYNIGISLLGLIYRVAAWFNPKARKFRRGRRQQEQALRNTFPLPAGERLVWIHCASLGEFEQGRPVIEALRKWKPALKVLLTFFSPSGYEVRKNYEFADYVFYLPWDTPKNAVWFAEQAKPSLAIFVKYEFWYHYTKELHKQKIPLISVSAIFRKEQIFFKGHGSLFRTLLGFFDHFFVQNQESVRLLQSININQVTQAGDTRFDRVYQITEQSARIPAVEQFKAGEKLMVIGSAWPEDMDVLYPFINENATRMKFIIAPHELHENFLTAIEKSIQTKSVRFSMAQSQSLDGASVLIIDNIGMLSRLYRYGEFAYVGGAFGDGLHNILEAACYGLPVFFGNKSYQKYQEAVDLVNRGGAFEIGDFKDLKSKYELMVIHPETYLLACDVTKQYVMENLGATTRIIEHCKKYLS